MTVQSAIFSHTKSHVLSHARQRVGCGAVRPWLRRLQSEMNNAAPPFRFCDPEGWDLRQHILKDKVSYSLHDYQLDGITHALDGG